MLIYCVKLDHALYSINYGTSHLPLCIIITRKIVAYMVSVWVVAIGNSLYIKLLGIIARPLRHCIVSFCVIWKPKLGPQLTSLECILP